MTDRLAVRLEAALAHLRIDRIVSPMSSLPQALSRPFRFRIRSMVSTDLSRVLEIERQCHTHPWSEELFRRELDNPIARLDLLWVGEELSGYLCSWFVVDELHILNIATAPAFRRRGVAGTLLRHVLARSAGEGMTRAFLEVRVGNQGAIALYLSFGFETVSRRPRYYADGEDALVMEYRVSPEEPICHQAKRENEE